MSAKGDPPESKRPASGETSGPRRPKSATKRESTFARVLDRALHRLLVVEEKLWQQIAGGHDDISSIQAWLSVTYEPRLVAGHRAKLEGATK